MKHILILVSLILFSTGISFAQCGRHAEKKAEIRQRSSLNISQGVYDLDSVSQISKKEAKKIATSQYHGKAKEAKLVIEDGAISWKIEVKGNEGQKELFIDPASGAFLGYGLTK